MANTNSVSEAVSTLRNHLLTEIHEAEQLIAARREQLRMLDALQVTPGFSPQSDREILVLAKAQDKGRTEILRDAMATFHGAQFTPAALQERALKLYPEAKDLLSIVAISKVLNKLLTQPTPEVVRLEKGAGRKEAIYTVAKK